MRWSGLRWFFSHDAFKYEEEFLGKSFCWIDTKNLKEIQAVITLAYNGINLTRLNKTSRNSFQRKIPNAKRHESYPAVLIGRFGVNTKYQGKGLNIGSKILDFCKLWFRVADNKATCRFIIVDAYNNPVTLHFYEKNGFKPLYKSEIDEKEAYNIPSSESLKSRVLYYDLRLHPISSV